MDTTFRLQLAPNRVLAHPNWRRARTAIFAALGRREGVVLLGPAGSGKTLLLRELSRALGQAGWLVCHLEHGSAPDLDLGADVLLVDEAVHLDADGLARLIAAGKPFVAVAAPSFAKQLTGLPHPITAVPLERLSPEEVMHFVAAGLVAAGRPPDLLAPDAVLALAQHSGGLPRLVGVLGGAAVSLAELERASRVGRRHVDAAAAALLPASAKPSMAARPHAGAFATRLPLPVRRRRAALGAAAAGLGLLAAGAWSFSVWRPGQRPGTPGSGRALDTSPGSYFSGQPPEIQPSDRNRVAENGRDSAGSAAPSEAQPRPPQVTEAPPPSRPSAASGQQPAPPETPITFHGPVYNETMRRGGQMSLTIAEQGPSGAVTVRFKAWGGLLGSGELAGHLSEDGHISASGQLMVGNNLFACTLSGLIAGDELAGSARFVHSSNGWVAHSRFTLIRS